MVSISEIRAALPPFQNKKTLVTQHQGTKDIVNEIIKTHELYETDYDCIYNYFDTGEDYSTCQNIWNFLKYNLRYKAESLDSQSVKSPSAILHKSEYVDCKHYSLFTGGVLDAIKANTDANFDWCYRFVSEDENKSIGHVFVVMFIDGNEIWVDPVLNSFNEYKSYTKILDKKIMSLYKISGTNSNPPVKDITVNADRAEGDFLVILNMNAFSLKDLMLRNPEITNGPVRAYYEANGLDFQNLLNILNAR